MKGEKFIIWSHFTLFPKVKVYKSLIKRVHLINRKVFF